MIKPVYQKNLGFARAAKCPLLEERETYLTVDGEEAVPLGPEEEVRLSRAESEACLIMLGRRPFYEVLNRKLMNR